MKLPRRAPRTAVAQVVGRAVLLQLAAAATAFVSCGHGLVAGNNADAGGAGDASTEGASGDSGAESGADIDGQSDGSEAGDDVADAASDAPVLPKCTIVPDGSLQFPMCPAGSCSYDCYWFNGSTAECQDTDSGLSAARCEQLCGDGDASGTPYCSIVDPLDGQAYGQLQCELGCIPGRRPAGLRATRACAAGGAVAAALAKMAHLEAASVTAFERLASELRAHGAPAELRRSALRAAADERRHARTMTKLAQRAGAVVRAPRVSRVHARSLEAMARENAVEGCVHETFAAAVAAMQGARAADASVRAKMRRIARDELRHAELAWAVARWLEPRLDRASRARVSKARAKAADALLAGARRALAPELVSVLGLPTRAQARALAEELNRGLWGRA